MKSIPLLIIILLYQCLIISQSKQIYIRFAHYVDDYLTYLRINGRQLLTPTTCKSELHKENSCEFSGDFNDYLLMELNNSGFTGCLAVILNVGTTEFLFEDNKYWVIPPSLTLSTNLRSIDGRKILSIDTPVPSTRHTVTFTIPTTEIYCSSKTSAGLDVLIYAKLNKNTFIPITDYIYQYDQEQLYITITSPSPNGEIINDGQVVTIGTTFLFTTLLFKSSAYGQSSIDFIANTVKYKSFPCQFKVYTCHILCKECDTTHIPDATNHRCTICIDGYQLDGTGTKCELSKTCPNYWYIDDLNQIQCALLCEVKYPYIDETLKQCKESCSNTEFAYGFKCLIECPRSTINYNGVCYDVCMPINTNMLTFTLIQCINVFNKEILFLHENKKEFGGQDFNANILESPLDDNEYLIRDFKPCIAIIKQLYVMEPNELIIIGVYIEKYTPIKKVYYYPFEKQGTLLNTAFCFDLQQFFISDIKLVLNNAPKYFNFIQTELKHLLFFDTMIFHNYKTSDDISSILTSNMTHIDLGNDCETLLKNANGIPINEPLIIYVIDYPSGLSSSASLSTKMKYFIFSQGGVLLDTSICSGIKARVPIPINDANREIYEEAKAMAEKGINVFDNEDPFFNDICVPFTTEQKTDIPRKDRVDKYFIDNSTLCPDECLLLNIDYDTNQANCQCPKPPEQESMPPHKDLKDTLLGAIMDANFDVIFCYKLVFNFSVFVLNMGSWFIIAIGLVTTINIIVFMYKNISPLFNYLSHLHQVTLKKEIIYKSKRQSYRSSKVSFDGGSQNGIIMYSPCKKKSSKSQATILESNKRFDTEDYNDMDYVDVVIYDRRTIPIVYWCSIKMFHPFINSFFVHNKRTLRTLKISKFFINIILDFSLSAFFYSDKYISNNYHNEGDADFLYNLPISIYSYLFGTVISAGLNVLSDSESGMAKIEQIENPNNMMKRIISFMRLYKIRVFFFNLFQVLLLLFFWYYVAAFCSVYQNSQNEWLISCITSAGISMCIPFAIAFVYSIIRVISIRCRSKCLYKVVSLIAWFF